MLRGMLPAGVQERWRDPSGLIALVEVHVDAAWKGHRLAGMEDAAEVRVAYLTRFGEGMLPTPRPALQDGDILHAMVKPEDVTRVRGTPPRRATGRGAMRVCIAGAGNVGCSIAKELLENGHEVLLIDGDPDDSCRGLRTAAWLLGDACELASWTRPAQALNVVVSATGDDKANLVCRCWPRPSTASRGRSRG